MSDLDSGDMPLKKLGGILATIGGWIEGFFNVLRAVVIDALIIAAVVLAVTVGYREVMRPDTVIEEIALPSDLSDLGYSGQVAAMRLVDAVNKLNDEAQRLSDLDEKTSLIPSSRQFELVEPQTGLSLRAISAAIDSLVPGRRTHVAGEFVCAKKKCKIEDMQLRLRVFDGTKLAIATAGPIGAIGEEASEGEIESYFRRSAVELLKVLDPIVIAERLAASATADPYVPEFGDQRPVLEEAIRLSKSLVRRAHEDDARAAVLLGQIFSLTGRTAEAERWFTRVADIATSDEAPLVGAANYNWGEMLDGKPEATEKWKTAERIFATSASDGRLGSSYLIWQGLTFEELGRFGDAEAVYQSWIAAEPENPGAHFQLAYLLSNQALAGNDPGRMEKAIEAFQAVVDIDPTHYRAYNEIAVLLDRLKRPVEALPYYVTADSLTHADPVVAENLRTAAAQAVTEHREETCALVPADAATWSSVQEKLALLLADACPP